MACAHAGTASAASTMPRATLDLIAIHLARWSAVAQRPQARTSPTLHCAHAHMLCAVVSVQPHSEVIAEIVRRTDIDAFTERVLDSFWDAPEFQRLRPPRDEVRAWVRW